MRIESPGRRCLHCWSHWQRSKFTNSLSAVRWSKWKVKRLSDQPSFKPLLRRFPLILSSWPSCRRRSARPLVLPSFGCAHIINYSRHKKLISFQCLLRFRRSKLIYRESMLLIWLAESQTFGLLFVSVVSVVNRIRSGRLSIFFIRAWCFLNEVRSKMVL